MARHARLASMKIILQEKFVKERGLRELSQVMEVHTTQILRWRTKGISAYYFYTLMNKYKERKVEEMIEVKDGKEDDKRYKAD